MRLFSFAEGVATLGDFFSALTRAASMSARFEEQDERRSQKIHGTDTQKRL